MNISKICTNLANKSKTLVLPRNNAKEVRELYSDIINNTSYTDAKIKILDRDRVTITGKDAVQNSLDIYLDFAKDIQNQTEHTKGYVFSMINPYRECIQEIKGKITGSRITRVKTTNIEKPTAANNYLKYVKTTDYENYVSGNAFRREETPNGVRFFRKIDGKFVEMFTKK